MCATLPTLTIIKLPSGLTAICSKVLGGSNNKAEIVWFLKQRTCCGYKLLEINVRHVTTLNLFVLSRVLKK